MPKKQKKSSVIPEELYEEYFAETEEDDGYISRSEKKRRSTAAQKLGEELIHLPQNLLKGFALPKDIFDAIVVFQNTKSHEGKRRQMQFIGKLMRESDIAPIEEQLRQVQEGRAADAADFHHLEILREDLLSDNPGVFDKFIAEHPTANIQHLRQLIRNARKERAAEKPPKAYRTLFRYLRELDNE